MLRLRRSCVAKSPSPSIYAGLSVIFSRFRHSSSFCGAHSLTSYQILMTDMKKRRGKRSVNRFSSLLTKRGEQQSEALQMTLQQLSDGGYPFGSLFSRFHNSTPS